MNKKTHKKKTHGISAVLRAIFILLMFTSIGLAEKREPVDFENDLIPVFTKMTIPYLFLL